MAIPPIAILRLGDAMSVASTELLKYLGYMPGATGRELAAFTQWMSAIEVRCEPPHHIERRVPQALAYQQIGRCLEKTIQQLDSYLDGQDGRPIAVEVQALRVALAAYFELGSQLPIPSLNPSS